MIGYYILMIDKKMRDAQIKEKTGFSADIITLLKRNVYISIESMERMCHALECGFGDILEFIPEDK